jgi:hypothetical protein
MAKAIKVDSEEKFKSELLWELWFADHHCLVCGWKPIEGVDEYKGIWGDKAICMRCGAPFPTVERIERQR